MEKGFANKAHLGMNKERKKGSKIIINEWMDKINKSTRTNKLTNEWINKGSNVYNFSYVWGQSFFLIDIINVFNKDTLNQSSYSKDNVRKKTIYIYAFSRCFYPKRLTVHSRYTLYCQYVCSLGIKPTTFALLTQCSTTEPREHFKLYFK